MLEHLLLTEEELSVLDDLIDKVENNTANVIERNAEEYLLQRLSFIQRSYLELYDKNNKTQEEEQSFEKCLNNIYARQCYRIKI